MTTTKKMFNKLFAKSADSKKSGQPDEPNNKESDEHGEFNGTQKLFRSKSGRLKATNKMRMSLSQDTFAAPEDMAQSAPVISMSKPGMGLASRDLPKFESMRVSRSLQFSMSTSTPSIYSTSTPTGSPTLDRPNSIGKLMDADEVF